MFKTIFFGLVALFITGCSTTMRESQSNAPLNAAVNANLKANIDVGAKISGSATISTFLGIFESGSSGRYADGVNYGVISSGLSLGGGIVEKAKAEAAHNAVVSSQADVIIMPRYYLQEDSNLFSHTVKVTVTGFKGTIRSVTQPDIK